MAGPTRADLRHVQLAGWSGASHVIYNGKGSSISLAILYGQCFLVVEFTIQKSVTFKVS